MNKNIQLSISDLLAFFAFIVSLFSLYISYKVYKYQTSAIIKLKLYIKEGWVTLEVENTSNVRITNYVLEYNFSNLTDKKLISQIPPLLTIKYDLFLINSIKDISTDSVEISYSYMDENGKNYNFRNIKIPFESFIG